MLGAHVSSQGGVVMAPARGGSLRATAIQLFTKTPNQWRERVLDADDVARFRSEVLRHKLEAVVAHDSYLINLASPVEELYRRSIEAFVVELQRAEALGLRYLVAHPGSPTDGDEQAGLGRVARALDEVQKMTDGHIQKIDQASKAKENEILQIK